MTPSAISMEAPNNTTRSKYVRNFLCFTKNLFNGEGEDKGDGDCNCDCEGPYL